MLNPRRAFVQHRSEFLIVLLSLISILVTQWNGLANLFGAQPPQAEMLPPLPDLSLLFLFVLIPLIVFQLTCYATSRVAWAWGASVLVLTLELLSYHWAPGFWSLGFIFHLTFPWAASLIYGLLLLVYLFLVLRRRGWADQGEQLVTLAMLGIVALGFVLRWQVFLLYQGAGLDPDMMGYRAIADTMARLYDTGAREPLWPWVVKGWFLIFSSSDVHVRLLTVFLSVSGLYIVYHFVLNYTKNAFLALTTILLMAINVDLLFMSVRGLRLELYIIIVVMLARYVLLPALRPGQRLLGLSLWATLAELLRFNSFTFILPLLFYAFWRHKLDWRKLALPILAVLLFMAPHLIHNERQFGDPFWSANLQGIWFRNYEFVVVKKTGCEGCPTPAEMQTQDSYAGSRTTNFHYIFGMHPLSEVIGNTAQGYWFLFVRHPAILDLPLPLLAGVVRLLALGLALLVYLTGLVLLLCSRFREVLLFPLLTINLIAFIVPIGDFAPRFAWHVLPFIALALAYGLWAGGVMLPRALWESWKTEQGLSARAVWARLRSALG